MAKKTSTARISALKFLLQAADYDRVPVFVCVGDDAFLRHEVRLALGKSLVADQDDGLGLETMDGRVAELRDVRDILCERSLFGGERRVLVVEEADAFVKRYREQLEDYVAQPVAESVLVLEVKTWPGNTRLAKAVAKTGVTISCQVPQSGRELTEFTGHLKDWLVRQAQHVHEVKLERGAVDVLLELLPTEPGILCQEIGRLALLTETRATIDGGLVRDHVGGWRTRKTWDMIDAAAEGRARDAIDQLDRLLAAGEEPQALLPQMASTLRRFAAAVRIYAEAEAAGKKISLRTALEHSGLPPFKMKAAEGQLRQIGRERAAQLHRWLLAADLQLKGYNSTKERSRRVLETLIVQLSQQMGPNKTGHRA